MSKIHTSNLNRLWIFSLLLVLFLLIFYIYQLVSINKLILLVDSYAQKIKELSKLNKDMEINFAQEVSFDNIVSLAKDLGFEKSNYVHYIRVLESSVAIEK